MQMAAGVGRKTDNIATIWRNFGFKQGDMKHNDSGTNKKPIIPQGSYIETAVGKTYGFLQQLSGDFFDRLL
jgi:hypothetical protein